MVEKDDVAERRQHRRVALVNDIECEYGGAIKKRPKRMMDLSVGGIYINVMTPPEPGTIVNLKFRLAGYEEPITVTGEVCYSQDGIGMGVRFLDLKPEDKEKIEKVIAKLE